MTKLGELMFQQTYSLDRLLAMPLRPQNYGLGRHVTYAKQRATAADGAATSPGDLVGQAHVNDLPDTLPADPQPSSTALADDASPVMSRLEALPPELVDAVLAALVSHSDLFALGCALPRLWPYVSRHVEEVFLMRKLGVWADTPIAIVSLEWPSDPGPQDPERNYPAGLLTADDVAEIRRGIGENEVKHWVKTAPGVHAAMVPVGLYELADARYFEPYINRHYCVYEFPGLEARLRRARGLQHFFESVGATKQKAAAANGGPGEGLGASDGSQDDGRLGFRDQLAVMLEHVQRVDSTADFYPAERGPYILRNLTTKEFVRAEALERPSTTSSADGPVATRQMLGPFLPWIKFGDVVAAHILWQEGARALPHGIQGMRSVGCWAGHRFDITTVERHERREGRAGRLAEWKDISERMGQLMKTLWRLQWGDRA
jgi:hypothetical protein